VLHIHQGCGTTHMIGRHSTALRHTVWIPIPTYRKQGVVNIVFCSWGLGSVSTPCVLNKQ